MTKLSIGPLNRITSSPNYKWWAYGAVAIGMFLSVMDQSGINIALPQISEHFTADIPTVQWITLGYSLATSAMLMPMGRLSDMIGRKEVYLIGYAGFVILAFVGGLSQSLAFLIAAKILQGIASAGVQANSMALITEVFPSNERGKAMGLYMTIIGTGAISGPIMGGLIVSNFGWRWVFFAGIPVGILAMLSAALILRGRNAQQSDRSGRGSFDWVGAALSSAALVVFLLAMTNGWKIGWTSAPILAGFAAAVVLLAAFIIWELRVSDPMLDLSLFSSRVFSLAISARFVQFMGGSAIFFLMPFYLIQGLGYEASRAALLMIPGSLCMAIVSPLAGRLSDRLGTKWLAAAGAIFSAAGMLNLSLLSIESPAWQIILGIFLSGLGMATFSSPNTSAIMGSLTPDKYGIVSGFVNLARTSANVTGVAISTTFVTITMASYGYEPTLSVLTEGGGEGVRTAFVAGLSLALKVSFGLMLLALALTLFRTESPQPSPEPVGPAQRTPASGGD